MGKSIGILGLFTGCCLNAVFLELLVKEDPGSGNLVTFAQFFFIALEGFIFTTRFGQIKRIIPIREYMIIVIMFFISNVCNNYAFNFNIAMPLHMIFRSGSLITNMIMGILILKRHYPISKYISVCLITLGVIICTIVSSHEIKRGDASNSVQTSGDNLFWWMLGICLLIFALFVSARLGIYQEVLFRNYGKHPYEALYYTHLLPLPWFLLIYQSIWDHLVIMMNSAPVLIPVINIHVPVMIIYLIGNVLTQYMCISSVYYLTTETSSFTVTLVLTLRKFASLIFSIIYFQNSFTFYHWLGTFLVFFGTLIFTEIPQKIYKMHKEGVAKEKKM